MWMSINHTEKFGPYSQHVRSTSKNTFNSIDSDEEAGQKSGASELNNLRGNHYEPPGIHVEPVGKQHENPTQVPELSKPAPAVAPRTSATYDGT